MEIFKTFYIYSGSAILLLLFAGLVIFSIATNEKKVNRIFLFNDKRIYLLLLWLLIPNILPFLFSYILTPMYKYRYTIGASSAFYLLVAVGIQKFYSKKIKFVVIGIILISSLSNILGYYNEVNKEPWRDVVDHIEKNGESGDLLLFNAGSSKSAFNYYSKRTDLIKESFPRSTRYVDLENIKKLPPTVENHDRVWLILSHSGDKEGLINQTLSNLYKFSFYEPYFVDKGYNSKQRYIGVEVFLFGKINESIKV
jgi:hypothetical protein